MFGTYTNTFEAKCAPEMPSIRNYGRIILNVGYCYFVAFAKVQQSVYIWRYQSATMVYKKANFGESTMPQVIDLYLCS